MIVSVDPGIEMGWAAWEDGNFKCSAGGPPDYAGVLIPCVSWNWRARVHWLRVEFRKLLKDLRCDSIHCEQPEFFDSTVGHTAARRGDLVKLILVTGILVGQVSSFKLYPVREWKGQLPKSVVNRRIEEIVGHKDRAGINFKSHAWDAVGVGLYAQGLFE